jgi:hypothetical protein
MVLNVGPWLAAVASVRGCRGTVGASCASWSEVELLAERLDELASSTLAEADDGLAWVLLAVLRSRSTLNCFVPRLRLEQLADPRCSQALRWLGDESD